MRCRSSTRAWLAWHIGLTLFLVSSRNALDDALFDLLFGAIRKRVNKERFEEAQLRRVRANDRTKLAHCYLHRSPEDLNDFVSGRLVLDEEGLWFRSRSVTVDLTHAVFGQRGLLDAHVEFGERHVVLVSQVEDFGLLSVPVSSNDKFEAMVSEADRRRRTRERETSARTSGGGRSGTS